MFLPKKIIKNKKVNYPQKNVGLHMCMVLKPCAHGFKTIYMVYGFKTMCKALLLNHVQ